jgi:hypothetical protein
MARRIVAALIAAGAVVVVVAVGTGGAAPASNTGWFHTDCGFAGRDREDPIVFQGQPGVSHSHDFVGPLVNADTTNESLFSTATNCFRDDEVFKNQRPPEPQADHSAYWAPTMYVNGDAVAPSKANAGYATGFREAVQIEPFPPGFRVIAGTSAGGAQTINGHRVYFMRCPGGYVAQGSATVAPTCQTPELEVTITFPDCWDGEHVDSPNHKSHAAYSFQGRCPSSHPVLVPQLKLRNTYPTTAGPSTRLAVGSGSTASQDGNVNGWHADFMFAWDPEEFLHLLETCIRADLYCGGTDGVAHG